MPLNASIRFRPFWLGLSVLLAAPVFAHDPLPANWCLDPNSAPHVVAHFDFSPGTLAAYRSRNPVLTPPPQGTQCSDVRSCGIVDDWFWANQLSREFCSAPALRGSTSLASAPMPFVASPEAFNAREHHSRYSFNSGHLTGVCVVCVSRDAPVPETPSASR